MPARVMIVEDEYLIRLLLEDMLSELGYTIAAIAGNLSEGKSKAESADIDVAILDVNIDGKDVFPVADILKARGKPYVFVTGYGTQGLPEQHRDTPTVQKPMQMHDLKATLARALGSKPKTA